MEGLIFHHGWVKQDPVRRLRVTTSPESMPHTSPSSLTAGPITGKVKKTLKLLTGGNVELAIPWKRKFLQVAYSDTLWFKKHATRLFNQSILNYANQERSSRKTTGHGHCGTGVLNCVCRNLACLGLSLVWASTRHTSHRPSDGERHSFVGPWVARVHIWRSRLGEHTLW